MVSLGVTAVITVAQLVTSVLAAYSFAFLRYPLKKLLFALTVATLLLPIEVTLVVNVAHHPVLGLAQLAAGPVRPVPGHRVRHLPHPAVLPRASPVTCATPPRSTATPTGGSCGGSRSRCAAPRWRASPSSRSWGPGASTPGRALAVTQADWEPLQTRLASLAVQNIDRSNIGFAGALIAAVPIVILLIVFQRQLIRGLTAGAVKG